MSTARAGSIATYATSQAPDLSPSTTLPAASYKTNCTGTPRRRASSRERSSDTPRCSPLASLPARIGLPKLIAARSVPVGASSDRAAAGTWDVVAHAATIARTNVLIASRIAESIKVQDSFGYEDRRAADPGFF